MSDIKTQILEAVAQNLREFGYPDARADNITSTRLFSMFASDQVLEFGRKHIAHADVQVAVASIMADIDKATGAEV